MGMAGLAHGDIVRFNEAALEIQSTLTPQQFPWQIHQAIRRLMGGEMVGVNWVDPRTSISMVCQYFPENVISEEQNALGQALLPLQLPMWMKCVDDPRSVSEFISRRTWMRRDVYWGLREFALEEHLVLDIPLSPSLTLMVADIRGRFGTYTDDERFRLKLLGPHIRQVARRLDLPGAAFDGRKVVRRRARVDLDAGGRVRNWDDDSKRLLAAYGITVVNDSLPVEIQPWFLAQRSAHYSGKEGNFDPQPMRLERARRILEIHFRPRYFREGCDLILQEIDPSSTGGRVFAERGLSARESEVLHWLAQGKTNAEIATILDISPGTVKRHLENIYPKLGVETRHAATVLVARAREGSSLA